MMVLLIQLSEKRRVLSPIGIKALQIRLLYREILKGLLLLIFAEMNLQTFQKLSEMAKIQRK